MHKFSARVYYEDTDLAGIVYYANYLKFIERARSEWVREAGIDQKAMKDEHGVVFAVRSLNAEYLRPAVFDDVLEMRTKLQAMTPARMIVAQEVWRNDELLFTAEVVLVCVAANGKPTRLPAELRRKFANEYFST